MLFVPIPLGERTLPRDVLKRDKSDCREIGPCGLGKEALYVGSRFFSRAYYIPWRDVRRVYKRVAMSSGGYTGHGLFASMAYLVVQFGKNQEKTCFFKRENELDALLDQIRESRPGLPTHSVQAEKRLAEAAAREQARYVDTLTPEAEATLASLRAAKAFLDGRPAVSRELTAAAKQKRIVDKLKPSALAAGTLASVLGLAAAVYGIYGLLAHTGTGMYFLLGGGALFFTMLSANLVPSRWTSRKYAQRQWDAAVEKSRTTISARPDFPVPPQYAHTVVLERMIRVVREGRAQTGAEALETVKADLKALNSDVKVSQQEHDEVVDVKPMFLICDYQN